MLWWFFYCLGLIIATWGWVEGTRQALRHALSFLLSPSDRYFQTVFSTGFHVIPLWTAKLTSLCIIENYRTKKTMKGVSFTDSEWEMKEAVSEGGGKTSASPPIVQKTAERQISTKKMTILAIISVVVVAVAQFWWLSPVLLTCPFPYATNFLLCFSLLCFLHAGQNHTTNVSHSNLPFIYKILYPWPGVSMCTGTHTQARACPCTRLQK